MPDLPDEYVNRDDLLIPTGHIVTTSGWAFLSQHEDDLLFLTGSQLVLTELRRLADGLDGALDPETARPGRFRRSFDNHPMLKAVKAVGERGRGEIALARYVDNYLTYLADILREVLRVKPEVLKSSQSTLTVEEALDHGSIEELRSFIADRAVTSLSYAGLADVDDFFRRRLGLRLFEDEAVEAYVVQAVLLRNLLTHRRGVVDERAVRAGLLAANYPIGERIQLDSSECARVIAATVAAVTELDRRVAAKFDLDVSTYEASTKAPSQLLTPNNDD